MFPFFLFFIRLFKLSVIFNVILFLTVFISSQKFLHNSYEFCESKSFIVLRKFSVSIKFKSEFNFFIILFTDSSILFFFNKILIIILNYNKIIIFILFYLIQIKKIT